MSDYQFLSKKIAEYQLRLESLRHDLQQAGELVRVASRNLQQFVDCQASKYSSSAEKAVASASEGAMEAVVAMYERNQASIQAEVTRISGLLRTASHDAAVAYTEAKAESDDPDAEMTAAAEEEREARWS